MAFTFAGGYVSLTAFTLTAQAAIDWNVSASLTGLTTAQAEALSLNDKSSPNWTASAARTRVPPFAGVNTVGFLNASAFGTVDHSASRRVLIAHVLYLTVNQIAETGYLASIASPGTSITYFSGATYANYVRLPVGGKDLNPLPVRHIPVIWKPGYTTGAHATGGTFSNTDVQKIAIHLKNDSAAAATLYHMLTNVGYVDPYVATGTDTDPMGTFFTKARTTDQVLVVERLAASQYLVRCALTWGNGSATACIPQDTVAKSIFWPDAPTSTQKGQFVSDGWVGFEHNAGRNDVTTAHTAVYSFTFPQAMYFRLVYGDGTAPTTAGTLKYVGWIITNASEVTIHAEWNIQDFIFNDCAPVDITDGAVTLSGTTTINGGTGAVQMLAEEFTNVGALVFNNVDDTSSNYCIRISGGTRSLNLPAITTDGTETKIIEYTGAGVLTLNQNASGDTITAIATGAGSVVVVSTDTWDIIVPGATGTRYRIVDSVDGELYNNTISSGPSVTLTDTTLTAGRTLTVYTTYQSGTTVKWGGPWAASIPSGGGDIDFTVNTPTTKTEFATWGIDGSTVTECASDYGNIEVEISTGSSTLDRRRILAFMAYAMISADGIRNWFGLMNILDTANVILDEDVADIHFVNTGAADVVLTTMTLWIRREDGAALLESGTKSLTMEVSPVYVISAGSGLTAGESAQLMAIPTNPATSPSLAALSSATLNGFTNTATSAALTTVGDKVTDIHKIHGLTTGTNLVVSPTSRVAGTLTQTITTDSGTTTVTRTA